MYLLSLCPSALDFWKIEFEKSSLINWNFCLLQTWILQFLGVKIRFKLDKKSSSSNSIFKTRIFKNQVQTDRGNVKYESFKIKSEKNDFWNNQEHLEMGLGNWSAEYYFFPNNKIFHRIQNQIPNIFFMNIRGNFFKDDNTYGYFFLNNFRSKQKSIF